MSNIEINLTYQNGLYVVAWQRLWQTYSPVTMVGHHLFIKTSLDDNCVKKVPYISQRGCVLWINCNNKCKRNRHILSHHYFKIHYPKPVLSCHIKDSIKKIKKIKRFKLVIFSGYLLKNFHHWPQGQIKAVFRGNCKLIVQFIGCVSKIHSSQDLS